MLRTRITIAATTLLLLTMIPSPSQAGGGGPSGGPFGLGVILYEPTGLTGKYWFDGNHALDFHLGVQGLGNSRHDDIGIYVDYLFHFDLGVSNSVFSMPLYLGPGAAIIIDDDDRTCDKWGRCWDRDNHDDVWLMARMPFGLSFLFSRFPGEAFIELSLQLWLIPITDIDLDAALGFRFYF